VLADGAGIAANRLETLQHADTAWVPIALGAILVDIAALAPAEQKRNVAKTIDPSICGRRMKVVRMSFPLRILLNRNLFWSDIGVGWRTRRFGNEQ